MSRVYEEFLNFPKRTGIFNKGDVRFVAVDYLETAFSAANRNVLG